MKLVIDTKKIKKYLVIGRYNFKKIKHKITNEFNKQKIMRNIIKTKYSKRKLNNLVMVVITQVVIFHLNFMLCFIISMDSMIINFFIHVIISVFLHFFYYHIFHMVSLYKPFFYKSVKYVINNYSEDNFRLWKIKFTLALTLYLLIAISMAKLDKTFLVIAILENALSFFIIDYLEQYSITTIFIEDPNDKFQMIVKNEYFNNEIEHF